MVMVVLVVIVMVSIGYVTYHSVGKILAQILKVFLRCDSVSKKFLILSTKLIYSFILMYEGFNMQ